MPNLKQPQKTSDANTPPVDENKHLYDMIIVGGGPGGYTAALYAVRAGLDTLILEKLSAGGQMAQTDQIDNYPGFEDGIFGFSLGEKMRKGAERFGVKTVLTEVVSLDLSQRIKKVETKGDCLYAKTLVLATGASPKALGLEREEALIGRGVSYCAACDGMFYRGKTAVVVGGGNSAAENALILSRVCQKVFLIHRDDTLTATRIYHKPILDAASVTVMPNSTVTEILGDEKLTGVCVRHSQTLETTTLPCDGLFVSVGRKPATELVTGWLALDPSGYVVADESTRTSIPGVFAVGDVRTKALRQIVTAVADGAVAVHYAEEYLAEKMP